jgi:hypothetical protein
MIKNSRAPLFPKFASEVRRALANFGNGARGAADLTHPPRIASASNRISLEVPRLS